MMKTKKNNKYVREVLKSLCPLTKLAYNQQKNTVPLLSNECIHKICESYHNLIHNRYQLSKKKLSKVKSHLYKSRKNIRKLAKSSTSLLSKRKLLLDNQTGKGIFGILASIIVPALIGAIQK